MKIRHDFVTNSSSTAYIITNKTDTPLPLKEFIKEINSEIIKYLKSSSWQQSEDEILSQMLKDCDLDMYATEGPLLPGNNLRIFGDEHATVLGRVLDYALRDGGSSKRFRWAFEYWLR